MIDYDATNPLHQTGIKMISAKPENDAAVPTITYAIKGIAAYGVAADGFNPVTPVPGDVNGDGSVNAADVTALYSFILNGNTTYVDTSDVNGDNSINAADVTAVYKIILGN
jgi:hypothetical protein